MGEEQKTRGRGRPRKGEERLPKKVRRTQFNRVTMTVPAGVRFMVQQVAIDNDANDVLSHTYRELIIEGIKATGRFEEYEQLWHEHVNGCLESGESSEFFLIDKKVAV